MRASPQGLARVELSAQRKGAQGELSAWHNGNCQLSARGAVSLAQGELSAWHKGNCQLSARGAVSLAQGELSAQRKGSAGGCQLSAKGSAALGAAGRPAGRRGNIMREGGRRRRQRPKKWEAAPQVRHKVVGNAACAEHETCGQRAVYVNDHTTESSHGVSCGRRTAGWRRSSPRCLSFAPARQAGGGARRKGNNETPAPKAPGKYKDGTEGTRKMDTCNFHPQNNPTASVAPSAAASGGACCARPMPWSNSSNLGSPGSRRCQSFRFPVVS
eukprot:gene20917-biopygen19149